MSIYILYFGKNSQDSALTLIVHDLVILSFWASYWTDGLRQM